jgi:sugar-specific transcriptional regulator TrmB
LNIEERVETLMELGLTLDQAKTYLALFQTGPATAKDIAEISKIAKPDIYRVIATLQKDGLVEKLVTKPASFQATSFTQVLPTMLMHKRREQNRLENRTEELLTDLRNIRPKKRQEEYGEFAILAKKEAIIQRIKEEILKAQLTDFTVTTQKRFSSAIVEFESCYRKALQKGVQVRLVTERHVPQESALKIVQDLSSDPNFQVKYVDEPTKAIVSIYDGKEACVTLSAKAHLARASAIWSNNPCFMELAQNYFESKWNKASCPYIILEKTKALKQ